MSIKNNGQVTCQLCGKSKRPAEAVPLELVRPVILECLRRKKPELVLSGYICLDDLNTCRAAYITDVIEVEKGELSAIEEQVVNSLREQDILSANINEEFDSGLTLGERLSDRIADFGGSWKFIIIFGAVLLCWIALNSAALMARPFDPYPYILLNLVLSTLAAIQAPIIMMSQNRQEAKDRLRSEHDYRVNLKAELEIRHLHEKMDHLLMKQWQRLLEIQEIQTEILEEMAEKKRKKT